VGGWLWQSWRGQPQWRQVQAAFDQHDLESAALHLNGYLERRPEDAAGWLLAGQTARRLGRYPETEACLTRCQQIGGVTEATRLEWNLLRVQQGDLGGIDARLRATITPQDPNAPLVLEALARGYLVTDRLLDALEACELWIKRQPDAPWPWLWRGRTYERLANHDQALENYQRAVKMAPQNRDMRLRLAALLSRGRQPGPSATHFRYVLDRFPDDNEALLGLAGCLIDLGESASAVPLLERVLASDPAASRALVLLGKSALEQGSSADAERLLSQALRQAPYDYEACHQLILTLRRQGKDAEADVLAPRLEALLQDVDRLDALIPAIAHQPEDAALRHEAGTIALRLGHRDEGVRWLQSALNCPGDHRASHAALAEHFAQQNDPRADLHRRLAESP
jgi:tetratricopeptide (TPR) repeat protein